MTTNAKRIGTQELSEKCPVPYTTSPSWRGWIIWGCVALFYLYKVILQVSPGVMTNDLMRDFMLTSTTLGLMASIYHHAYVAFQIPCGVIVDWLGTRRVVTLSAIFCAVGSLIFAQSHGIGYAQFGRLLIGAGAACAFLSSLKAASEWFPPEKFALLAGLTNMMGTIGGTFAGKPFAMLVNAQGWRTSMMILAVIGGGISIAAWLIVRDRTIHPEEIIVDNVPEAQIAAGTKAHVRSLLEGLKILAANKQSWIVAIVASLSYLPLSAFTELWAVPFLMHRYGIDNEAAASANVMLFVGVGIGSPLVVWISDYLKSRIRTMGYAFAGSFLSFLLIIWLPVPLPVMYLLLLTAGLFTAAQILCFASVKESNSDDVSATAVGFTNAIVMCGPIIFQPFMGHLLDLAWGGQKTADGLPLYSSYDYQMAMTAIPICLFLSAIMLKIVRETYKLSHENSSNR